MFPSFVTFPAFNTRPSSPFMFFAFVISEVPVSTESTLAAISSLRLTPFLPIRLSISLLSSLSFTVTVLALMVVETSPATSPSYV